MRDPLKIDLFNRHLFNQEIKKSVAKATHRNLKDAFDAATNAERRAKRFEGLTDDSAAVMKVNADSHKINQISADTTNQQQQNTTQAGSMQNTRPFDPNRKKKSDNNCFKCGERGHYAHECPMGTIEPNSTYPPTPKVLISSLDGTASSPQIVTATQPPKVVQTITSEGQLPTSMWNTLLTQLTQAQNENMQMKQFVKKYIPYNKRNQGNAYAKQTNNQNKAGTTTNQTQPQASNDNTKNATATSSKVNKIELDTRDDMLDNLPSFMLDLLRDGDDEFSPENSDGIVMEENPTTHINVVLSSDATMASDFPVKVNDCSTTCLLDTGASHSCMSYECFKNAFPKGQLQEIRCIKVENASGKSMEPKGLCEATVTLGPKDFIHTFIVCKELTSSVILGLDFSS